MNIIKLYYLYDLTGLQSQPRTAVPPHASAFRENAVGRDTVCEKLIFPNFFFKVRIDLERELQTRFEMMRSQTFDYFIIPTSHIHQISGIDQITWRHIALCYNLRIRIRQCLGLLYNSKDYLSRMNEYKGFLRIRNLPIKNVLAHSKISEHQEFADQEYPKDEWISEDQEFAD
ncbi:hypothetical protein RIR_jg41265.t1 [Rhizophagus irregularis DAOM 181602=DAOM 197198]|nr:hypothetical protein RIR_jg41265.t1 [Rhizophagus irregularis DAOM 181602=DAOM 197198]